MRYFFILFLVLLSCKNNSKTADSLTSENLNEKSKRIWLKYGDFDEYVQYEYYIKGNDSIQNQFIYIENNKIDTLISQFYDLSLKKTDSNKYKGKIKFYSAYDTAKVENRVFRSLEFSFAQKKGDSTYWSKYKFDKNYELYFEYEDYKDESVIGYLNEIISVSLDSIRSGEGMINLINSIVIVDNKPETDNPFVELFISENEKSK